MSASPLPATQSRRVEQYETTDPVLRNTYATVLRVLNETVGNLDLRERIYSRLDRAFPELNGMNHELWEEGL